MSYTYNGNPGESPRDEVRFLCGDTDMRKPLLTDAELAFLLRTNGDTTNAALQACYAMLRKLALRVDETVGPVSVSNSERVNQIKASIQSLRYQLALGATPWAGGISVSDKAANRQSDVVQPVFTKTMLQPRMTEGDPGSGNFGDEEDGELYTEDDIIVPGSNE